MDFYLIFHLNVSATYALQSRTDTLLEKFRDLTFFTSIFDEIRKIKKVKDLNNFPKEKNTFKKFQE